MPRLPTISSRQFGIVCFSSSQRWKPARCRLPLKPPHKPRLAVSTSSVTLRTASRFSSSGWLTSRPLASRSCTSLRHAARVRRGGRRPVHRLLEPRSRDQLHRPRDLADVADRLASFIEEAWDWPLRRGLGGQGRRSGTSEYLNGYGFAFGSFLLRLVLPAAYWRWNSLIAASILLGEVVGHVLLFAQLVADFGFWSCMNVRKSFSQACTSLTGTLSRWPRVPA